MVLRRSRERLEVNVDDASARCHPHFHDQISYKSLEELGTSWYLVFWCISKALGLQPSPLAITKATSCHACKGCAQGHHPNIAGTLRTTGPWSGVLRA